MKKLGIMLAVAGVCALLLTVNFALAKQEFHGTIEKMPESGMVGEWVISGRAVQVVPDTKLEADHGPLQVGAYVEVEGVEFEGKFIATEIETEKRN